MPAFTLTGELVQIPARNYIKPNHCQNRGAHCFVSKIAYNIGRNLKKRVIREYNLNDLVMFVINNANKDGLISYTTC